MSNFNPPIEESREGALSDFAIDWAKARAVNLQLLSVTTEWIVDRGTWEPNQALRQEVRTQYQTRPPHRYEAILAFCNEDGSIWQAKPVKARIEEDGKEIKYETPIGGGHRAFLPRVPVQIRQKIGSRYGVEVPETGDFWDWFAANPTIPLIGTEGPGKTLAALSNGYVAIGLMGAAGGIRAKDSEGNRLPTPELIGHLQQFAGGGREIYFGFDRDTKPAAIKRVNLAIATLGRLLEEAGSPVDVVGWNSCNGKCKGLDDLIAVGGISAFESAMEGRLPLADWRKLTRASGHALTFINKKGEEALLPASKAADALAKLWGDELAYNCETESFWSYGGGLWTEQPEILIQQRIQAEARFTGLGHGADYVSGILKLFKGVLAIGKWREIQSLIPLRNGCLDPKSMELLPHSPDFKLRWQLPYDFNPTATCEPIIEWLKFTQEGAEDRAQLLRAWLKAVVLGRVDLQRYLELVGNGGGGKSTFVNLAIAMVGLQNVRATSLKVLEKSQFETATIYGKRLVYITDAEQFAGDVSVLKSLTGGDPLPIERKYKQSESSFFPRALTVVVANEPIATRDYTSGLARRRIVIPFDKKFDPDSKRTLIEVREDEVLGEFAPYISGLLNWVLAMPNEQMEHLILRTDKAVPSLQQAARNSLIETNSIAAWLDSNCVFATGATTPVGSARERRILEKDGLDRQISTKEYDRADSWLYANYRTFCDATNSQAISLKRFGRLLKDLCVNQLGRTEIEWVQGGREGACFKGIALRQLDASGTDSVYGDFPSPISERDTAQPRGEGAESTTAPIPISLESKIDHGTIAANAHSQHSSSPPDPTPTTPQTATWQVSPKSRPLKPGDSVRYVGNRFAEQYGTEILRVAAIGKDSMIACRSSKGEITTWLYSPELQRVGDTA